MTIMDQCGTDMDKMDIDDGKNKTCQVDIIDDSKTKNDNRPLTDTLHCSNCVEMLICINLLKAATLEVCQVNCQNQGWRVLVRVQRGD